MHDWPSPESANHHMVLVLMYILRPVGFAWPCKFNWTGIMACMNRVAMIPVELNLLGQKESTGYKEKATVDITVAWVVGLYYACRLVAFV